MSDSPPVLRLTWRLVAAFLLVEAAFAALIVGACLLIVGGRGAGPPAGADKQIMQVLAAQCEAWNRGDLEGFMAGYWQSDELTFYSFDKVTKGWQATLDRFRQRYQTDRKDMGRLSFTDVNVTVLDRGYAVVRGRYVLRLKDGTIPEGLFTLIMRYLDGQWRIVHDHTSAPEKT